MTIKLDRRTLLQTGLVAAGAAMSVTSAIAQQASAKLTTHALDTYLGKTAAGIRIDNPPRRELNPAMTACMLNAVRSHRTLLPDSIRRESIGKATSALGQKLTKAAPVSLVRFVPLADMEDHGPSTGLRVRRPPIN